MTRSLQCIAIFGALTLIVGCGGNGKTYSPVGVTTSTPDWEFQLAVQDAAKSGLGSASQVKRAIGEVPILTDLGTLTPGQDIAPIRVIALALEGFDGLVNLTDVASSSPDHIAAVPSLSSITPTVGGAPFTVGFSIPANYPFPGIGVEFQGRDAQGRIKQELIAFKVSTVSGSFAPVSFTSNGEEGSGTLAITPINGFTGPIAITFDTNLTGAPTGFLPLPGNVTVMAPASPVTISGTTVTNTPIDFSWSSWPAGDYEVIAVLSNGTMAIRVPVQITVTSSFGGGGLGE